LQIKLTGRKLGFNAPLTSANCSTGNFKEKQPKVLF